MIASDDEVIRTIVSSNKRMPKCLPGSGQAHCERQQCEKDPFRIIVVTCECFVGANPCEVVDVARLGQFFVGTVQRITSLERDNVFVTHALKCRACLSW